MERDLRALASRIDRGVPQVATSNAEVVANKLREYTPIDTGALRDTIHVSSTSDGAAVHYGADLRYAAPIAKRTQNVAKATADEEERARVDGYFCHYFASFKA